MKHYLRMNKRGEFAYDYRSGAYKNYKDVKSAERWSDWLYPIIVELDTEEQTFKVIQIVINDKIHLNDDGDFIPWSNLQPNEVNKNEP